MCRAAEGSKGLSGGRIALHACVARRVDSMRAQHAFTVSAMLRLCSGSAIEMGACLCVSQDSACGAEGAWHCWAPPNCWLTSVLYIVRGPSSKPRACAGGNIRLVAALAEGLPIMYNSPVQEIRHCATGVAVRTPSHEFRGGLVACTLQQAQHIVRLSTHWPV